MWKENNICSFFRNDSQKNKFITKSNDGIFDHEDFIFDHEDFEKLKDHFQYGLFGDSIRLKNKIDNKIYFLKYIVKREALFSPEIKEIKIFLLEITIL